jgi:isopenicillin N synthase-like dioxygenase
MTQAIPTAARSIQVIDISPLRDGSNPDAVAQALLAASQNPGFIYISGHGIPDDVIARARARAFDFFHSPEKEKRRYTISDQHRGWLS